MTDSDARSPKVSRSAPMHTLIDPTELPAHPTPVGEGGRDATPLVDFLPPPSSVADGQRPTVCLAMLTSGDPEFETMQSLLSVTRYPDVTFIGRPNGPYMDMGRNELTIAFYRDPSLGEWLIFVDDDVADFTYAHILDLTQSGHHIVGGAYSSPHDGKQYIVAYNWGDGIHGPMTLVDLTVDDLDSMPPEPTPIAAIGTGFLAIHRSVIEAFPHYYDPPQPWFAELTLTPPDVDDVTAGIHLGEDMTFCLRANALGVPVHVHPCVRLTHYKKLGIRLHAHPSRVHSPA